MLFNVQWTHQVVNKQKNWRDHFVKSANLNGVLIAFGWAFHDNYEKKGGACVSCVNGERRIASCKARGNGQGWAILKPNPVLNKHAASCCTCHKRE